VGGLFSRLSAFSRLILFDKRGTGLSDRVAGIANLAERMDDVRAVMDFRRNFSAASAGLVLYGSYARHPLLTLKDHLQERIELIDRLGGTGDYVLNRFLPTLAVDEAKRRAWARFERQSASPPAASAMLRMNAEIDTRDILPVIRVPTLVMHRVDDGNVPVEAGRYLARNIVGAKYVELPGDNHAPLHEPETVRRILGEVEEFLTGSRSEIEIDRVLATVMFTDIVDSTKRAAELGDREWRTLRERHDSAVRQLLTRFRGHEVKNLGDGFLATFDGPARAIRCAAAISDAVRPLGIAVRSGLHTGEIELTADDVTGIAVHIAARVAAEAAAGETVVSSTARDLVAGSGLRFEDRGIHALRDLPNNVHLYTVLHAA
jgi:class 3 adenylate cyclase